MVLIAVHGSATRYVPAERGTVHLTVEVEHDDRGVAMAQVGSLHERLRAEAEAFVRDESATWWGSDQVRAWAMRRYLKDSEVHRVVQAASAEVRVKFRDFDALSGWIDRAGSVEGVTIAGTEWTVTDLLRVQVQREVRVEAVADARRRAEAYASAIGGTGVVLQSLWEPGLRPHSGGVDEGGSVTRALMASPDSSASIELRPDDIEIAAEVTADFLVAGGD